MTKVAILDYDLGNLFSVKHACQHVGMSAEITDDPEVIAGADIAILPGVGAYRDAMHNLTQKHLTQTIYDFVESGRLMVGICLGLQLFMTRSHEYGIHQGLNLIAGEVQRFDHPQYEFGQGNHAHLRQLKVPQVGWNNIQCTDNDRWQASYLHKVANDEPMYFVHSYYVVPEDETVVLATADYGGIEFCASIQKDNIFACQFHPERSGKQGLEIYKTIAEMQ